MRLKDHYQTLGVHIAASGEDIRKAFRKLALQYHPDRNQESPFAEGHFRELKEAYNVLGDEQKRQRYDEERWLLGMAAHKPGTGRLTPGWIAGEAGKLRQHMEQIDTYRMSHDVLQSYVLMLLGDEHLAIVKENEEATEQLVKEVLSAIGRLKDSRQPPIIARLQLLSGGNATLDSLINNAVQKGQAAAQEERMFPWIMAGIILIIIVLTLALLSGQY